MVNERSKTGRRLPEFLRAIERNCVSLFVTNFPESSTVSLLWDKFASFGFVVDVFIPFKRNAQGDRFAFVRYKNVVNQEELLLDLQDVWVEDFNLKVNISRFGRDVGKRPRMEEKEKLTRVEGAALGASIRGEKSYLKVVSDSHGSALMEVPTTIPPPPLVRSVALKTYAEKLEFFSKYLVGFLRSNSTLESLCDALLIGGFGNISARTLGGDVVLLSSDEEQNLQNLLDSNDEDWFHGLDKIIRWTPEVTIHWRDVWLCCWEVPVQVWGVEVFSHIGGLFGEVLDVDEETLSEIQFDRGRVKVRLPVASCAVDEAVDVEVGGYVVAVRVLEELGTSRVHPLIRAGSMSNVGDRSSPSQGGPEHFPANWEGSSEDDNFSDGEDVMGLINGCSY